MLDLNVRTGGPRATTSEPPSRRRVKGHRSGIGNASIGHAVSRRRGASLGEVIRLHVETKNRLGQRTQRRRVKKGTERAPTGGGGGGIFNEGESLQTKSNVVGKQRALEEIFLTTFYDTFT